MKFIFLVFASVFFIESANSQLSVAIVTNPRKANKENNTPKKLFIKLYTGSGMFTPGSYRPKSEASVFTSVLNTGSFRDTTVKGRANKGIGGGLRFGVGIGLVQNDFLNIGLDLEYTQGKSVHSIEYAFIDKRAYRTASDQMKYSAVTLTPHVILKALARPKFFLYNKLGVTLTLPSTLKASGYRNGESSYQIQQFYGVIDGRLYENFTYTLFTKDESNYDISYKIRPTLGLNVAFGINFRLGNKLRAFTEFFGNYSALSPYKSVENNYYKYRNITNLDSIGLHFESLEKKIQYGTIYNKYSKAGLVEYIPIDSKDLGVDGEGYEGTQQSAESKAHRVNFNMAALGINVGIVYRF